MPGALADRVDKAKFDERLHPRGPDGKFIRSLLAGRFELKSRADDKFDLYVEGKRTHEGLTAEEADALVRTARPFRNEQGTPVTIDVKRQPREGRNPRRLRLPTSTPVSEIEDRVIRESSIVVPPVNEDHYRAIGQDLNTRESLVRYARSGGSGFDKQVALGNRLMRAERGIANGPGGLRADPNDPDRLIEEDLTVLEAAAYQDFISPSMYRQFQQAARGQPIERLDVPVTEHNHELDPAVTDADRQALLAERFRLDIEALDRGIRRVGRPVYETVYRTMEADYAPDVGEEYVEPGFMATSPDRRAAEMIGQQTHMQSVLLVLTPSPDVPALSASEHRPGTAPEFTFPRGTRIVIDKVDIDDLGRPVYYGRIVGS